MARETTKKRSQAIIFRIFWAFILPVLEYCSPIWMSVATSPLSLLDRVVSQVGRLSGVSVSCDLWHRRKVASLSVLKILVFQNFLSSRTQRIKVDGVFSSSIDVVFGVTQGSVLGPLLFLLYIADLPRLLQNELVGYAAC